MKKQNLLKFLFAALTLGLVVACNDSDPAPLPEKMQKLTQTDWKIQDITTPKKGVPAGDSSIVKPCTTDDVMYFGTNGVYELTDGTTICDSTIFNYSKGYWGYDLTNDSIQLAVVTPSSRYVSWKVLTINDSVLKVTYMDSMVPANKILKTVTFKK